MLSLFNIEVWLICTFRLPADFYSLFCNNFFNPLFVSADHLWRFDKAFKNWPNSVATISDERASFTLETNAFINDGMGDLTFESFEVNSKLDWINSKQSLYGDCLTTPKYCPEGMSLSLWLSGK